MESFPFQLINIADNAKRTVDTDELKPSASKGIYVKTFTFRTISQSVALDPK